jgi:hypothetical protein
MVITQPAVTDESPEAQTIVVLAERKEQGLVQ